VHTITSDDDTPVDDWHDRKYRQSYQYTHAKDVMVIVVEASVGDAVGRGVVILELCKRRYSC